MTITLFFRTLSSFFEEQVFQPVDDCRGNEVARCGGPTLIEDFFLKASHNFCELSLVMKNKKNVIDIN